MNDEIELINDGEGLAVIGDPAAVDRFLNSHGLESRELNVNRVSKTLGTGAGLAKTAGQISTESGRWVKLTEKSAQAMKVDKLMKGSTPLYSRGVLTKDGKITGLLEFVKADSLLAAPGTLLTNPALLSGLSGIMTQLAMEQTMEEITDYLKTIDEKLDDVLRGQKDTVLAGMIGVGFVIEEALTVRDQVGRVSEVTWSKVQATTLTIAHTQAYALRAIDHLVEKTEAKGKLGDLGNEIKQTEAKVNEWLAVLARCFQLHDAISVLELDRVLDHSPKELDKHRDALLVARNNRIEHIIRCTERLIDRMNAAAAFANTKVLFNPVTAKNTVRSSNTVKDAVTHFLVGIGIESSHATSDAKRWLQALSELRDDVVETASDGVDAAKRIGGETAELAAAAKSKAVESGTEGIHAAKSLGTDGVNRVLSITERLSRGLADRLGQRNGEPPALESSAEEK
ncbi:hypothetical protein OK351_12030 [Glutamicibacter sp. MNS18]|uniref:hypothetical protein n=1 Tax=Glutamicibacter sp. MNS18 TaxID=2989817 RepID=UPI0022357BB9|nr:hypothetical protein [Glutamicibacter sp. MNS18]MCW4466226.1 hypothetical protein [Glutamicibacter sp. MNS18]